MQSREAATFVIRRERMNEQNSISCSPKLLKILDEYMGIMSEAKVKSGSPLSVLLQQHTIWQIITIKKAVDTC